MIYAFQLYYMVCTLFLAGKDADSYLLKDRRDNPMSYARVKRWHRDGLILAMLFVLPLVAWLPVLAWKTCLGALLIRLSFFDLPFNRWASLPPYYLGGTAWVDGIFVKIFGQNGGLRKSLAFFVILVLLNLLNHFL
jgi:hypothetical protein